MANEAAMLIAVVVLPTPPFWLAIAMARDKFPSRKRIPTITRRNLAELHFNRNLFHVEHTLQRPDHS
jgi:hypothetical protein